MFLIVFCILIPDFSDAALDTSKFDKVYNNKGEDTGVLYEQSHALIIGISDYTNGWPDFPGVNKDLVEVSSILKKLGFSITIVKNPDSESLNNSISNFINEYGYRINNACYFISSGSADESIFRSQLIEALKGEADSNGDNDITGIELGEFLQSSVTNYSKGAQHPQYEKIRHPMLDKGDFVFILPKQETPTPPISVKQHSTINTPLPPPVVFKQGNFFGKNNTPQMLLDEPVKAFIDSLF